MIHVTRSRVTPAVGSTIEIRRSASQFSSELFPTFGRPVIATFGILIEPTPATCRQLRLSTPTAGQGTYPTQTADSCNTAETCSVHAQSTARQPTNPRPLSVLRKSEPTPQPAKSPARSTQTGPKLSSPWAADAAAVGTLPVPCQQAISAAPELPHAPDQAEQARLHP